MLCPISKNDAHSICRSAAEHAKSDVFLRQPLPRSKDTLLKRDSRHRRRDRPAAILPHLAPERFDFSRVLGVLDTTTSAKGDGKHSRFCSWMVTLSNFPGDALE